jgi:2-methylisocitrate lyase-like PEP mutase family enzyme
MRRICNELAPRIPLLANMVEGGNTPIQTAADLEKAGYRMVIFPGALVRATAHADMRLLAALKKDGCTRNFASDMLDFEQLNRLLGTQTILEKGAGYAAPKSSE